MSNPGNDFRLELETLRDSVLESIRKEHLAQVRRGLSIYRDLVRAVITRLRELDSLASMPTHDLRSAHGQEMVWLHDDIRRFIRAAGTLTTEEGLAELDSLLFDLLRDAWNFDDVALFGESLQLYQEIWGVNRPATKAGEVEPHRRHVALMLENFGDAYISPELRASTGRHRPRRFALRLLAELCQLGKLSIDAERPELLRTALQAMAETLTAVPPRSEISRPSPQGLRAQEVDDGVTLETATLSTFKGACALALDAWIAHRDEAHRLTAGMAVPLREVVRDEGLITVDWNALQLACGHETERIVGWGWWESLLHTERRSGILRFHSDIIRAFAARIVETDPEQLLVGAAGPGRDRHVIRQLREAMSSAEAGREAPLPTATGTRAVDDRVEHAILALSSLEATLNRAEDEVLAEMPLSENLVKRFREEVVRGWSASAGLRSLLSPSTVAPTAPEQTGSHGFGFNRLYPKDFFVDRADVHAPPDDLGRDLANGLVRGEDELIVATLEEYLSAESVEIGQLPDRVKAAGQALQARSLNPIVLLLGRWDLIDAVGELDWGDSRRPITARVDDSPLLRQLQIPVISIHRDAGDRCLVVDVDAAVRYNAYAALPEEPEDEVVGDGRLLIGVRGVDSIMASQLLAVNPVLGSSDDAAAMLNLRKQVRVRVLEQIEVGIRDSTAGVRLVVSR